MAHAPVSRVHGDYTESNAPLRLAELQGKGLVPPEARNYTIVNTWRNIAPHPVASKPLALLDATTVDPDSVFTYALVCDDKVGFNNSVGFDPNHHWIYYPDISSNELLVFYTFDGRRHPPRFVFHTAFDFDHTPPHAPPRHSIEVRSLVLFHDT